MSDTTHIPPHIGSLKLLTDHAVNVAADAKHLADQLRTHYAKALLKESFPDHTLAIFIRNWDEDRPSLLQLLSHGAGVDDIDLTDDEDAHLSSEQDKALAAAEHQIRLIGSDDDLLNHLDPSDEDHGDWFEFQLPLDDD